MEAIQERFFRYVRIDTQSDEASTTTPSTPGQWELLRLLASELRQFGLKDVNIGEHGYVVASIPASPGCEKAPTIAFLAHVDTAPDFSGKDVKPIAHENYQGTVIVLPDDPSVRLDPKEMPELKECIGETIITASGKTLLGGDDKAGVTIIMNFVERVLADPSIKHGPLKVCFNPDEEIGRGVQHLDLKTLNADYAYTLDAEGRGVLQFETFSADRASVKIEGVSIHPGYAKNKMVNALKLAAQIISRLPAELTPETTSGKTGFIHPYGLSGSPAMAEVNFILRDFELEGLAEKGKRLQDICAAVQATEPRAKISCTITRQYRNMRYWLEKDMRPVNLAKQAIENAGMKPTINPIRGGTDGSVLTERGLLTPNLSAGEFAIHGPREWVSVQDLERAVGVLIELSKLWSQETRR